MTAQPSAQAMMKARKPRRSLPESVGMKHAGAERSPVPRVVPVLERALAEAADPRASSRPRSADAEGVWAKIGRNHDRRDVSPYKISG